MNQYEKAVINEQLYSKSVLNSSSLHGPFLNVLMVEIVLSLGLDCSIHQWLRLEFSKIVSFIDVSCPVKHSLKQQ